MLGASGLCFYLVVGLRLKNACPFLLWVGRKGQVMRKIILLTLCFLLITSIAVSSEKQQTIIVGNYGANLYPDPDSTKPILKVPVGKELTIIRSEEVRQGIIINPWYCVQYKGKTGWISGHSLTKTPELKFADNKDDSSNPKVVDKFKKWCANFDVTYVEIDPQFPCSVNITLKPHHYTSKKDVIFAGELIGKAYQNQVCGTDKIVSVAIWTPDRSRIYTKVRTLRRG